MSDYDQQMLLFKRELERQQKWPDPDHLLFLKIRDEYRYQGKGVGKLLLQRLKMTWPELKTQDFMVIGLI